MFEARSAEASFEPSEMAFSVMSKKLHTVLSSQLSSGLLRPISTAARGEGGLSKESSIRHSWWTPDPVTGVYVPDGNLGSQIDIAKLREERCNSVVSGSGEARTWWTSLEEIPDRPLFS